MKEIDHEMRNAAGNFGRGTHRRPLLLDDRLRAEEVISATGRPASYDSSVVEAALLADGYQIIPEPTDLISSNSVAYTSEFTSPFIVPRLQVVNNGDCNVPLGAMPDAVSLLREIRVMYLHGVDEKSIILPEPRIVTGPLPLVHGIDYQI